MKLHILRAPADQIQAEFERVAERIARTGREMALPMEVVLLQVPAIEIEQGFMTGGAAFIVAFHTAEHAVAYIDEEGTLVEIDYLTARVQGSKP